VVWPENDTAAFALSVNGSEKNCVEMRDGVFNFSRQAAGPKNGHLLQRKVILRSVHRCVIHGNVIVSWCRDSFTVDVAQLSVDEVSLLGHIVLYAWTK
jgi:hypothetical protein